MHHLTLVYSNIYLGCLSALRLFCIDKSLNINSFTVVSTRVVQQCFAVIAAFSYAAAFDLMKNANRQAGYVTQCRVSGGVSDWTKNRTALGV